MSARACGGCTMCCKVMMVEADDGSLFSPWGKWCKHAVVGQGCRIYADPAKPKLCSSFRCLWQIGWGDDEHRPDRLKIVGHLRTEHVTFGGRTELWLLYSLHEGSPGAFDSSAGKRLLEILPTMKATYNAERVAELGARVLDPFPMELTYFDGRREMRWRHRRWPVDPRSEAEQAALPRVEA